MGIALSEQFNQGRHVLSCIRS